MQEKFEKVIFGSAAAKADPSGIKDLWNAVSERLYSLEDRQRELGLGDKVSMSRKLSSLIFRLLLHAEAVYFGDSCLPVNFCKQFGSI